MEAKSQITCGAINEGQCTGSHISRCKCAAAADNANSSPCARRRLEEVSRSLDSMSYVSDKRRGRGRARPAGGHKLR